jgi:1,4-alpha-glucan branching enzyme
MRPATTSWGDVAKTRWQSDRITLSAGGLSLPLRNHRPRHATTGDQTRSLFFGDPCARETDAGVFSVFHVPRAASPAWTDGAFKLPPLEAVILYELNVAEFGGDFKGVADRIPYLRSLGVNAIELLPINSIAEPNRWGYMPIFYFSPEERFGGPTGLRHLVSQCHAANIAVVLDMVYAHTDRMFPYQIGYERFFHLWADDHYTDDTGTHRSPNPLVCAYDNFGRKNDWRMASTREFFAAVNAFWLEEYHIDGFRYDHVNGYLDRTPIGGDGAIDWYSQENRPTFESLKELTRATYAASKKPPPFHARCQPGISNHSDRRGFEGKRLPVVADCGQRRQRQLGKTIGRSGPRHGCHQFPLPGYGQRTPVVR